MDVNGETGGEASAYVRLSSTGSNAQLSLAAQQKAIEEYAEKNGLDVTGWYVDEGHAGTNMERPALKKLLAAAEADGQSLGTVLVWKWSRLSRSAEGLALHQAVARRGGGRACLGIRVRRPPVGGVLCQARDGGHGRVLAGAAPGGYPAGHPRGPAPAAAGRVTLPSHVPPGQRKTRLARGSS